MAILYRGVCNIYEALNILKNHTAGGQTNFDVGDSGIELLEGADVSQGQTRFDQLDAKACICSQRGTCGERYPRIVNIKQLRPLIEYTYDKSVAIGFGLLGVITISIDDIFIEPSPAGREMGAFCVSNANLHGFRFELSRKSLECELVSIFLTQLKKIGILLENGVYIWQE